MRLSTTEQLLVEQRLTNEAKSAGVAYLLWLILGPFGAHRFYVGRTASGVVIIVMFLIGLVAARSDIATLSVSKGSLILAGLGLWLIVDLLIIPGLIIRHKDAVRERLTAQIYGESLLAAERLGRLDNDT